MTRSGLLETAGEWDNLLLSDRAGGTRFSVRVRPRSSRSTILGVRDGVLDVALTSPPADGAANRELIRVLARALDVRAGDMMIVIGASCRDKLVEVNGLSSQVVRARLSQAKR